MKEKEIWTISEITPDQKIKPVSFELIARARGLAEELGAKLSTVVLGSAVSESDLQELIERGADQVYWIRHPKLAYFIVENYSQVIQSFIEKIHPQIIIAAATTFGRTLMPHLSVQLGTGLTADCTDLSIEKDTGLLLQTRPAIGGNIMATIKTPEKKPQMATVRPKSVKPLARDGHRKGQILSVEVDPLTFRVVPEIMTQTRIIPTSIEFMDQLSVQSSCQYLNEHFPYQEAGAKYDLLIPCYGHAGDGNLHATLVKNPNHSYQKWLEVEHQVLMDLYLLVKKKGGTISG